MANYPVRQIRGLNLKINPLDINEGELIRSVNVESNPILAKRKRSGYVTYLGTTPNGESITGLANFTKISGTQFWNYAFAGGLLYYSTQGTGAWTICGNGTWNSTGTLSYSSAWDNGTVGTTNVLFVADGVGTIRHSSSGTSFVDTSGAPAAAIAVQEFKGRMYAAGTNSYLFWSNFATVTDWSNDSSNVLIPGLGQPKSLFKTSDRLIITKNSGEMFRWNTFEIADLATRQGPTSKDSIGNIEDYRIYLNRQGFFGYGGAKPELLSNSIERVVYNDMGSGIIGTTFDNAPAVAHNYKYHASIGTVTDDLTSETVSNAEAVYDYQLNEWGLYSYANRPTSYLSYKDIDGVQQRLFAGGSQVYQVAGTANSDNGSPIEAVLEGVIHYGQPETTKRWNYLRAFFNPGCEANVQVALSDTFTKATKTWINLGDARDGAVEYKFKPGAGSKLLFYKITDSSVDNRFTYYGLSCDADLEEKR